MGTYLLKKLRQSFRGIVKDEEDEPFRSAEDSLSTLFGDSLLSDVRLQGSDEGTVVAVKAVLAARSPVFHARFFGTTPGVRKKGLLKRKELVKFQEWDFRTLHLVVEFCYTDNLSVMQYKPDDDTARLMANLRAAAKAFKLPRLLDKANQWSWRQINRHPSLSCALIDEGMKRDDIDKIALQSLKLKARAALLPGTYSPGTGVLALTKPALLFVLDTLQHSTSHILLLDTIQRWVELSTEDGGGNYGYVRVKSSREAFARKYAMPFINLSNFSPGKLEAIKKKSDLFKSDDSLEYIEADVLIDAGLQYTQ